MFFSPHEHQLDQWVDVEIHDDETLLCAEAE